MLKTQLFKNFVRINFIRTYLTLKAIDKKSELMYFWPKLPSKTKII